MPSRLFWLRGLFAALFLLVTYLTLTPNPEETESGFALARWVAVAFLGDATFADKVGHFLGYGALGASAFWAQLSIMKKRWAMPIALALYGAGLEGLQGLGGVRSPELADALANALGVVTAFVGAFVLAKLVRMRAS